MPEDNNNGRIFGREVKINQESVKAFFEDRAKRYDPSKPLVAVLYQDSNPELARARDEEEKRIVLNIMKLSPTIRVLDVGCGIGRWAETIADKVAVYHGTDLMPEFISIARERCARFKNVSFQALPAQELSPETLETKPPFDLILVTGLLIYLTDDQVRSLLGVLNQCVNSNAQIIIREPIGIEQRLTLNKIWSEELKHEYSSIYRTTTELKEMFAAKLPSFRLVVDQPLFASLNNRKETRQHLFCLEKE